MAINTRSPRYISTSNTDTSYTTLDIYIWEGSVTEVTTPKYSLKKYAISGSDWVGYEISELIRDYIDTVFDGNYNGQSVWFKSTVNVYDSSKTLINTIDSSTQSAFDSYSYFEENQSFNITSKSLLISNREMFVLADDVFRIPIHTLNNPTVMFLKDGETVSSQTLSSSTESSTQIKYISSNDALGNYDSFKSRVFKGNGAFEDSKCLQDFLDEFKIGEIDAVRVYADSYGDELITNVDLTSIDWLKSGVTPSNTVVTSGITSPISDTSAYNVSSPLNNSGYVAQVSGIEGVTEGNEVEVSVYLKGSGTVEVRLQQFGGIYASYANRIIVLTSSWTEYKLYGTKSVDGYLPRLLLLSNGTNALNVDVWHPSVKESYGSTLDTIKVVTLEECKYEPKKVTFVNKFGVLQDMLFFKKSVEKMTVEKESYKANTRNQYNQYSISSHVNREFNVIGNESISLSSGYLSQEYNEVFKQLMLSEKVWVTNVTDTAVQVLPINVKTSDITYKTSLNDKLVEYTIEFDNSYNTINNIR